MLQINVFIQRLLAALIFISFTQLLQAKTIHVDINASAGGDGVYWSSAFNDLQDALAVAVFGDTILVAEGSYLPTDDGDRTISFALVDGVTYLGGFTSTDTLLAQRDWEANQTVLSGDLSGNGSTPSTNSDNSYSVVFTTDVTSQLVVDGFIIFGGNAPDSCSMGTMLSRSGGGWYNDGSFSGQANPTIRNCRFVSNYAVCGGAAMFNNGTEGGHATPNYTDVSFEGNRAYRSAGAIYNNGHNGNSNPSFLNCKFIGNHADTLLTNGAKYAGAMYNFGKNGNANIVLVNCLFESNSAFAGGAIYNLGNSNGNANPTIINCTFYNNRSVQNGGACYVNGGDAGDSGQAVATVINTIYYQNTAGQFGGDIFRNHNGTINIQHTMVDVDDCASIAEGGPVNCLSGMLYNANPLFVDEGAGDFTPDIGSSAINAGLAGVNGLVSDLVGNPRVQQGSIDMGAIESPFAPLPIALIKFEAELTNGITELNWTTATEYFNDYFEIQRSHDGINYQSIGRVKGSNYSTEFRNYRFQDSEPEAGANYYRLLQVDFNRTSTLSEVRLVHHHETYVQIFPNPAVDKLFVSLRSASRGTASFHIYNLLGMELQRGEIEVRETIQTAPIQLSEELEAGQYLIYLDFGNQYNQSFRFIKTRN